MKTKEITARLNKVSEKHDTISDLFHTFKTLKSAKIETTKWVYKVLNKSKRITITIDNGIEDIQTLKEYGRIPYTHQQGL